MSAPTFTPGPWDAGSRVVEVAGSEFTPIDAPECAVAYVPLARHANARLIAAAPELYAALERLIGTTPVVAAWGEHPISDCDCPFCGASAALAKARGEQS